MSPVEVGGVGAGVRVVDDGLAVGGKSDLFDHEIAGGEQHGLAVFGFFSGMLNGVEVLPPVAVGEIDQRVVRGPADAQAAGAARDRIERFAARRNGDRLVRPGDIGDHDRPRLLRLLERIARRAAGARRSHERNLLPVHRPHRILVVRGLRIDVADWLAGREQGNEAVVAAVADEGERLAVGRPDRRFAVAARGEHRGVASF